MSVINIIGLVNLYGAPVVLISETCSSEGSSVEAKDHTNFLVFMMSLNGLSCAVYTFGFKADYRRRRANQRTSESVEKVNGRFEIAQSTNINE